MSLFNWMIDLDQESNISNLKKENQYLKARVDRLDQWVVYLHEELKKMKVAENAKT